MCSVMKLSDLSSGELCLQSGRVVLDDEEAAAQDEVAGGHPQHGAHQDHLPAQSGGNFGNIIEYWSSW